MKNSSAGFGAASKKSLLAIFAFLMLILPVYAEDNGTPAESPESAEQAVPVEQVETVENAGQVEQPAPPGQPGPAPKYGLRELIKAGLEQSETVSLSREDLFIAGREADRARAALLPRLSIFGDYTKYSEQKTALGGAVTLQPDWSSSYGARVDETLSLSGREFTAYRAASMGIEKAEHDLYAVREDYALRVALSYYSFLRAKKAVEIAGANVERLKKHRDAAETRFRVGEATKTVVLRAEAELSAADSGLIKAKNGMDLARASLGRVAGIPGDYEIAEVETSSYESALSGCLGQPSELECLKSSAASERAELKSLVAKNKIAEHHVSISRGAFWPTITLEGDYVVRDSSPVSISATKETIFGVLRLNFPIFEGGLRRAEVRQANARKRQAALAFEEARKNINLQVEEAYLDMINQRELLEAARRQLVFAKDNYNAVSRQYELGLASSLDAMDANTLLITAESQMADVDLNFRYSVLKLLRAAGLLLRNIL